MLRMNDDENEILLWKKLCTDLSERNNEWWMILWKKWMMNNSMETFFMLFHGSLKICTLQFVLNCSASDWSILWWIALQVIFVFCAELLYILWWNALQMTYAFYGEFLCKWLLYFVLNCFSFCVELLEISFMFYCLSSN